MQTLTPSNSSIMLSMQLATDKLLVDDTNTTVLVRSPRASPLFHIRAASLSEIVKPPDQIFNTEPPYMIRALTLERFVEKVVTQQGDYEELLKLLLMSHHVFMTHSELLVRLLKYFDSHVEQREWICDVILKWMKEYVNHWFNSGGDDGADSSDDIIVKIGLEFVNSRRGMTDNNTLVGEIHSPKGDEKSANEHFVHKFVNDIIKSLQQEYSNSEDNKTTTIDENITKKLELIASRLSSLQDYYTKHHPSYPLAHDWSLLTSNEDEYEGSWDDDEEDELEMPSETKFEWKQLQEQEQVQESNILDWSVRELAIQLTLIDAELFCAIDSSECVSRDYHEQELKKSPNIALLIDRFDTMNRWVVQQILNETELDKRVQVLSKLIDLMRHLYQMDNYHSLMAIFSALSNQSVFRLKKTMSGLNKQDVLLLKKLDYLLNPSKRFRALVDEMQYCDPPCIPYLGVLLSQLSAVQTCYDNKISVADGVKMIHINKFRLCSKVVAQLHTFQKHSLWYSKNFTRVPHLYNELLAQIYDNPAVAPNAVSSEQCMEKSLLLEPRSSE
jgi:hypothetical protein